MIRSIPKDSRDRYFGEGDACLRDKATKRICAWSAGTEPETWKSMLAKGDVYESIGYWDEKEGMIV